MDGNVMSRYVACFLVLLAVVVEGYKPQVVPYSGGSPGEPCQPEKLTVYKVVLHTFWSRDTFPKHYPDWRPAAQWSKVFGEFLTKLQ